MRLSGDEIDKDGTVKNGFDYLLQVWVKGGIVQRCGHRDSYHEASGFCNAGLYHGKRVRDVEGHEIVNAHCEYCGARVYDGAPVCDPSCKN